MAAMGVLSHLLLRARPLIDLASLPGSSRLIQRALHGATGELEVSLRSGVRLRLDLADRIERLMAFRAYERDVLTFLRHELRPGMVVLDVGAHVGYHAIHAAIAVGPRGSVHAFEPVPRNASKLRQNVILNGLRNVEVVEAAVAAKSGRGILRSFPHGPESGWASLLIDADDRTQDVPADLVALDEYVQAREIDRVDVIKLDIQGGEYAALQGSHGILRRWAPAVICELADVYWGKAQTTTVADVLDLLEGCGYRPYTMGARPTPLVLRDGAYPANAVFLRHPRVG